MLSCSFALFLNRLLHTTVYFWRVSCVWILCWEHKLMPTASPCTALCMHAELWRAHTHHITLRCTIIYAELQRAHAHRITLHCTVCGGLWRAHTTVSHCTALCGSLCGICRAVSQLSAQSYSGCTRFLLVVFFFFAPLCQFCLKYMEVKGFVERDRRVMVCLWGGKHG